LLLENRYCATGSALSGRIMISINSDIRSGPHSSPPPVSTPIIDHLAKYNHKFWELLKITFRKIVQRILIEQNLKCDSLC